MTLDQYPHPNERSLAEYYTLFLDFLQLHAFVTDVDSSLDSINEMNLFIGNTKYNVFLTHVTH